MARKEGLQNELEKYQKEFASKGDGDLPPGSPGSRLGELVLVFNDGLAPYKREHSVAMVDPGTGRLLRVSLPYYQERRPQVAAARLTVGDAGAATEVVENINAVALADLDAQMPMIAARSLARVIAKKKMEDSAARDSPIAGALLNVAAVLTEEADTRSWNTLPYNIQLVRMPLAPGHYPLKLELMDDGHRVVATPQLGDIVIRAEHKTFVSYYWSASSPIGGH